MTSIVEPAAPGHLALAAPYAAALPAPRARSGCFCVEEFLATQWRDIIAAPGRHRQALDALAKKVEVGRRLFAFYDVAMRRPAAGETAGPAYAALLCAVFLAVAEGDRAPRFLNTALKMADGILLEPGFSTDGALNACIERQLAFPFSHARD